jgi:hypothetical protein
MATYSPDFMKEILYEPSDEELGNIEAGPGKVATVGGLIGRFARKWVADPVRGMYRAVDKARTGKFKSPEEMGSAALDFAGNMAGTPGFGSGLGSGARVAVPWQSRTLDTVLGNTPAGKKMPESATPMTWASKLKGAGLPKSEYDIAERFLDEADLKSKMTRKQLAAALEFEGLPTQGVTVTELGGPKWVAGQKRLDEIPTLVTKAKEAQNARIHEMYKERGVPVSFEEYSVDHKWKELHKQRTQLLQEQMQLATDALGKRPHWPQYNIEGLENPREVLYHGKPKSGESEYINSDMKTHYGEKGENLIFHQREGELKLPDGKKSTHISEQQSDWHAERAKQDEALAVIKRAPEQAERLQDFVRSTVPEPPMKDTWYKTGFKDAVKRAVEAGHDYVTWDTADTQIKRWPAGEGAEKYFKGHYDEKLVKFAAKEYGAKPEKVKVGKSGKVENMVELPADNFDDETATFARRGFYIRRDPGDSNVFVVGHDEIGGTFNSEWNVFGSHDAAEQFLSDHLTHGRAKQKEVWRIPITEDMKRKVLLEGQYWTKKDKAATPGGRNAEGIA